MVHVRMAVVATLGWLLVALPCDAAAQGRRSASSGDLGFGFGIGGGALECDTCPWTSTGGQRHPGALGRVHAEFVQGPRVGFTGALEVWHGRYADDFATSGETVGVTHGLLTAAARFHPVPLFFVEAGYGATLLHRGEAPSSSADTDRGSAFRVGAGVAIPFGPRAVSPKIDYVYSSFQGLNGSLVQLGVDVTFY